MSIESYGYFFQESNKENINVPIKSSSPTFSTIYLVRHGQTIGNAARVFLDPSKEVLSPKGRMQATAAGEHLSGVKFDRAYASSLVRARNTAKIILQHSQHPLEEGINFDERIKEVDYSVFKGKSYEETQRLRGKNVSDTYPYKDFYVEGTEEIESVLLRLDSFWNELFESIDKSSKPETILIVSHATLIRIFMKYLKLSSERFRVENFTPSLYSKCLKNTAYHKFQIERRTSGNSGGGVQEPRKIIFWETHKGPHLETRPIRTS